MKGNDGQVTGAESHFALPASDVGAVGRDGQTSIAS
jgi:hypothetical protein